MSKKVTAIIACVPVTASHPSMTHKCVESFRPVVDKIILVQNSATQFPIMQETVALTDHYIFNKENRLHAGAINQGALLAQDDEHIMIICDDVYNKSLTKESIQDILTDGIASVAIREGKNGAYLRRGYGAHSMVFALPKKLFWEIGPWKLSEGHIADEEWFARAQSKGVQMSAVENESHEVIHSHPGSTIGLIPNPPKYKEGEV